MLLFHLMLLGLLSIANAKSYSKSKDAVLLSKIRTLTLHAGKQTSARRVRPIPQLTCTGGNACKLYEVDVLRCKNSGSEYDAEDIQWTCQASLPSEFKLGSTEVICEGYDNPDDPYVLKGSCGVEYRLVLTEQGEQKYGVRGSSKGSDWTGRSQSLLDRLWSILFWGVFIAIIFVILYKIFNPGPGGVGNNPAQGFFGGGGGGGGGYGDDPPPPYTPRAPPYSKPRSYGSSSRSSRSGQTPGSSGPGFWSGAATGGATGYGAGYYMGQRQARNQERQRQQGGLFGGGGRSSWFGGGGGSSAPSSSSSAPTPSSSRYESTGFGGTRRR